LAAALHAKKTSHAGRRPREAVILSSDFDVQS
jgi:hypothetical protein